MRRAVLDTNVVVSGTILKKGIPFELLAAWRNREWDLVVSPHIIRDVERVLHLPKISRVYSLSNQDIGEVISLLTSRATVVSGDMGIPRTARDPDGDHILACAKAGQADYIVTGDQDLLSLEQFEGIPIVSPAAFAAILRTSS